MGQARFNPEMEIDFKFSKKNLQFIWLTLNSSPNCHNFKETKLVTRLRSGLSHLYEHKFKHSFQDFLNLTCKCSTNVESYLHFSLHSPLI